MVKNKLYKMHGIASSLLVLKWDVPFTNPGVTDTAEQRGRHTAQEALAQHCGGLAENRSKRHCLSHDATHVSLGRNTYNRHTRGGTISKHFHKAA